MKAWINPIDSCCCGACVRVAHMFVFVFVFVFVCLLPFVVALNALFAIAHIFVRESAYTLALVAHACSLLQLCHVTCLSLSRSQMAYHVVNFIL